MVPCSRLYGFLGCTLVAAFGRDQPRHAYSDWLDTYSAEDYLVSDGVAPISRLTSGSPAQTVIRGNCDLSRNLGRDADD